LAAHSDSHHHLQAESAGQVSQERGQQAIQHAVGHPSDTRSQKPTLAPAAQCRARLRVVTTATVSQCCLETAQIDATRWHCLAEMQIKDLTGCDGASQTGKTRTQLSDKGHKRSFPGFSCALCSLPPGCLFFCVPCLSCVISVCCACSGPTVTSYLVLPAYAGGGGGPPPSPLVPTCSFLASWWAVPDARCAVVVLLAGNPTRLDGAAELAALVWTPSIVL
jgi:hypothetical protein